MNRVKIFTDGGARGNPGNSACAFVVYREEKVEFEKAVYLGITTNNVAEYSAVEEAIKWSAGNHIQSADFYLDSELVVKQMRGEYKIKDKKLKILYDNIQFQISNSKLQIYWYHVPRSQNKRADFLVNQELDKH